MSPEQVRSLKNVDARADVWALGAILHELLTASPPFDGPSASALHAAIAMDAPTPLRARRPDAPAELEAVITRCLEKKPADRFQDVGALAAALSPFATERGRTSAGRIDDVVRTTATSTTGPGTGSTPSGDAPTLPLGVASTINAFPDRGATDGAWEQKRSADPVPAVAPVPPSRIRAGAIAAAVLLLGGAAIIGFALKKEPTTTAPPPLPSASIVAAAPAAAPSDGCQDWERSLNKLGADPQRQAEGVEGFVCKAEAAAPCQVRLCLRVCGILGKTSCVQEYTQLLGRQQAAGPR